MWRSAWAKAPREQLGEYETWLPLDTHLKDTGYLIRHLWDHWLGEGPKQVIVHDFGGDAFVAKQVATFAAVLHDIGKLTPAFAGMVLPKRNHMESAGFRWPAGAGESDGQELRHALAGHIIVRDFLIEQGAPPHNADSIAVIIG